MKPLMKLKSATRSFVQFIALVTACVMVLSGCTSLRERAETMLHDGRVDEALTLIENGRNSDPQDPDLAALERKIRARWISDKLIQVRLARLAESKGESIELMRKILKNENEWGMIPTGAVFATQAEESLHLSEYVQSSIYDALAKKRPLEATARFRHDRALLEELLKIQTVKLKSSIANAGNQFCQTESGVLTENDFYSARFLKKSCDEFQNPIALPKTRNSVTLFRELVPNIQLVNLPVERASDFSRELKTEFEKSIWYDAGAPGALNLNLSGPVVETISTQSVYRSKPYTVRVPYEEATVRKKSDSGSRTGLGLLFDVAVWLLTAYVPNREVDNRDGTVTVYETKYRDETRHFTYAATEVTQTLSVDWKISLSPKAQSHTFKFKDRIKTVSDEHSVSFPEANIQPQTRTLIRPADWLLALNRGLMDRIGAEFNNAWIERFCRIPPEVTKPEIYHRCIYGANGHAPSLVNEWFTKRYGIEIEAWRQLVAVRK